MSTNIENIIISSWPSAGGSTAARFVALVFEMKYIYAGSVLKRWADKMGYNSKTNAINAWAEKYHDYWDLVWEGFIAVYAKNSSNTVFEGMTAGFLLDNDNLFKIFIKASTTERDKRAKTDGRTEDISTRDDFLRKEWLERFAIDFYDESLIKNRYDFVVDSSNMGIKEVSRLLITRLGKEDIRDQKMANTLKTFESHYRNYQQKKTYLISELEKRNLLISADELLIKIYEEYTDLVKDIPQEMKEAMY